MLVMVLVIHHVLLMVPLQRDTRTSQVWVALVSDALTGDRMEQQTKFYLHHILTSPKEIDVHPHK